MDEAQIAAQTAKNIPTEEHIPAPVVPEEPQQSAFETNMEINDPAISLQLIDYFNIPNIDRFNEHTQRQLRTIYQWAAETAQSKELDKVLPVIRTLENELGATFTTDKLQRLAKFVTLQKQANVLRYQMEHLYG